MPTILEKNHWIVQCKYEQLIVYYTSIKLVGGMISLVEMWRMNQNGFKVKEWVNLKLCRFFSCGKTIYFYRLILVKKYFPHVLWIINSTSNNFHWSVRNWFKQLTDFWSLAMGKWQWIEHHSKVPTLVAEILLLFLLLLP